MCYRMRKVAAALHTASTPPCTHNPVGDGTHTATVTRAFCDLLQPEPSVPSSRKLCSLSSISALHLLRHFRTRPHGSSPSCHCPAWLLPRDRDCVDIFRSSRRTPGLPWGEHGASRKQISPSKFLHSMQEPSRHGIWATLLCGPQFCFF